MFSSWFESVIGSEFVCLHVCDDVAFETSVEFCLATVEKTNIGQISEVEENPLSVKVGGREYGRIEGTC